MSILCSLGIHKWNKYGALVCSPRGLTQFRVCKKCGKISCAKCYGSQANSELANRSINRDCEGSE